jgi:hypothetical protein
MTFDNDLDVRRMIIKTTEEVTIIIRDDVSGHIYHIDDENNF